MPLNIYAENVPLIAYAEIATADGTGYVALTLSDPSIKRFDTILVTNQEAASKIVQLAINNSVDDMPLGTVTIPSRAGWDANPCIDLIAELLLTAQPGIPLGPFQVLRARLSAAMDTDMVMQFTCLGGVI